MAKPTRFTQQMMDEYVSQGYWDFDTLVDISDRNAVKYPDKQSFGDSRVKLTWAQLKELSDRLAIRFLELGIKKDDVVVVQLPNWVEIAILRIAFLKAGILSVFPAMTYRQTEIERAVKSLDAVGVVIPFQFRKVDYFGMVQEIRPNTPSLKHLFVAGDEVPDGAISLTELYQRPLDKKYPSDNFKDTQFGPFEVTNIMSTSGTTGVPKFCEHSQVTHKLVGRTLIERARITRQDVVGAIAPLSGGTANYAFVSTVMSAAKGVLLDWFEAEDALKLIERERITIVIAVPAQIIAMLRHPNFKEYDLSSLRVVRVGGSATPPNIAAEIEEKTGCKFISGAGSMDAIAITQSFIDDPPEVRYLTAGRPAIGNEVKLIDEYGRQVNRGEVGELQVRGACTASGYYKDVAATKEAWGELGREGWWRSGDLARFDDQGNVVYVGRKKDIIIRGAQNIYPIEIENLLFTNPKISQVAIVGMPDSVMGERACAYVVIRPGTTFTFDEMVSFLREKKIAPYKLPERLEVVSVMPWVGDVTKVDKKALTGDLAEKLKAEGTH